jgi:hypothetical protein
MNQVLVDTNKKYSFWEASEIGRIWKLNDDLNKKKVDITDKK